VPAAIVCELGYHQSIRAFDRGLELRSEENPGYFHAIRQDPIVAIQDAGHDERTHDLRTYLASRQIGALLDTAVRVGGQPVGILCHEHVGGPRRWTELEQQVAFAIGQIIATRVAIRSIGRDDERQRKAALLADVMSEVAEAFGSSAAASSPKSKARRSPTLRPRTSVRRAWPCCKGSRRATHPP
jgi:hypothetical protein